MSKSHIPTSSPQSSELTSSPYLTPVLKQYPTLLLSIPLVTTVHRLLLVKFV
eukprot:CAMPEP_0174364704 /NCGR_PEP_ID=MMETSP0811_2-20130205/74039_1 /TAXON_ID=73025 ORGANISM="Eutreptiella gymnastica-like, Strain CCMP1594" /NCGR_SAMPLE_ID=MMETSP0811_2 /ASSEMBLY_ACC=CAM_ASM_000667 /LENGTH=51 /DNA_ID=CAMNT_0015504609 /DNA_START=71 /DNA_END=226 /DNA_ORIENTATION=+